MSEKLCYNDDDMCKWVGECPGCELSMCYKHRSVVEDNPGCEDFEEEE